MSDKGNNGSKSPMNPGEISTIRNILMGEQISATEQRFDQLESKLRALEESFAIQLDRNIQTLKDQHQKELDALSDRVDELQKEMHNRLAEAVEKLSDAHRNSQQELGKMLLQIGQELIDR